MTAMPGGAQTSGPGAEPVGRVMMWFAGTREELMHFVAALGATADLLDDFGDPRSDRAATDFQMMAATMWPAITDINWIMGVRGKRS